MKIGMVAGDDISIARLVGRAVGNQLVADDLVKIEVTGKDVVTEPSAPQTVAGRHQSAGGGGAFVNQHRHQLAGHRVAIEDRALLAIDSSVDGVDQSIPMTGGGVLEEGATEDALAVREEGYADGVV